MRISLTLFIVFSFGFNSIALSWTEKTHETLSEYAAENSVLRDCINTTDTNCDYLKNLGFEEGIEEYLQWYKYEKIRKWLAEGAHLEDETTSLLPAYGVMRSVNHFHNPLKPWLEAGLDDWFLGLHYTGQSSLMWAQDKTNQENHVGGDWSWKTIRDKYYWALTDTTEAQRQMNFAQTFRGLGHQIHLIEDAAQPDHVRNDAHPLDSAGIGRSIHLEKWAGKRFFDLLALQNFVQALPNYAPDPPNLINYFPNVPLNVSYNNLAPITQFIDTKQYYNSGTPSTGLTQGIAEYTNANFASDDTIFTEDQSTTDRHYFPYPRKSSTNLQELINKNILPETVVAEDGVQDVTLYIKKDKDGEIIDHFLKPTYTATGRWDLVGGGQIYELGDFYRDEKCHEDYAQKLIPRAVGYSAGLLDYFFRGSIEITLPNSGVYGISMPSDNGFKNIKLLAKNTTANNEEMTDENGSIELVVKYRLALEDPFRDYPEGYPFQAENFFRYIVVPEANNTHSIPRDTPVELTFDLTQNPIPFWAIDVYLQVVYKGRLGNEDSAIAVGFKDISEPTPIDLFSNTDKICLYNTWYNAGSPEAIALVDANHDGRAYGQNEWDVYPHDQKNIYIKFSRIGSPQYASPSNYDSYVSYLTAGNLSRKPYILSDYGSYDKFYYSMYASWMWKDSNDWWTHLDTQGIYYGYAIKNQTDYVEDSGLCDENPPCYIWFYPNFYTIRGIDMWWGTGLIYYIPPYPTGSTCPYNLL